MTGFNQFGVAASPRIFTGAVVEVYAAKGTVDIKVDPPEGRFYEDVSYASAFKDNGLAGFDFVPTRGCRVLLLEHVSQDVGGVVGVPLIIGFTAPPGKAIGARTELLPSDVQVQGKYGNNLLLRSNGDVYLIGDAQNLIAFIAAKELTKIRSANYEHEHAGGRVSWTVDGEAIGGAVAYLHTIKRNVSDDSPYISVAAGTSASGGLEIRVATEGGEAPAPNPLFINDVPVGCAFKFSVDEMGHTGISALGALSAESVGPFSVSSSSGIALSAPQLAFMSAAGGMSVTAVPNEPMRIVAPEGIEIVTPSLRIVQDEDSLVHSDNTEDSKELLNIDLMSWLKNHVHFVPTDPLYTMSLSSIPLATEVSVTDPGIMAAKAGVDAGATAGVAPAIAIQQAYISNENDYTIDESTGRTTDTKAR